MLRRRYVRGRLALAGYDPDRVSARTWVEVCYALLVDGATSQIEKVMDAVDQHIAAPWFEDTNDAVWGQDDSLMPPPAAMMQDGG